MSLGIHNLFFGQQNDRQEAGSIDLERERFRRQIRQLESTEEDNRGHRIYGHYPEYDNRRPYIQEGSVVDWRNRLRQREHEILHYLDSHRLNNQGRHPGHDAELHALEFIVRKLALLEDDIRRLTTGPQKNQERNMSNDIDDVIDELRDIVE